METSLKHRLIGAGVLVALAVIFLPMLVKGPAPDGGAKDVSLHVPEAPQDGFETRELPLVGDAGPATPAPVQTAPGTAPVLPYGYGGYAPARKTNGLAVASMILSIVGFLWILPFVGSLAGAIMGHISLNQIKRSGEGGRGMALAGIIVGWAGLALLVIGVLFFVFVIALGASSGARYGA